jgi:prevent-host-death family protein
MKATAKDLRFHTGALLDTVARGEEVIITYHGAPKALLIAIRESGKVDKPDLFGMWRDRKDIGDPGAYVRKIRRGRFS